MPYYHFLTRHKKEMPVGEIVEYANDDAAINEARRVMEMPYARQPTSVVFWTRRLRCARLTAPLLRWSFATAVLGIDRPAKAGTRSTHGQAFRRSRVVDKVALASNSSSFCSSRVRFSLRLCVASCALAAIKLRWVAIASSSSRRLRLVARNPMRVNSF